MKQLLPVIATLLACAHRQPAPPLTGSKTPAFAAEDFRRRPDAGEFGAYFSVVKERVRSRWLGTEAAIRRERVTIDRFTLLAVELSPAGQIKRLRVDKSSGVPALDDLCIEAFQSADPFPPPPARLIQSDRSVRFSFGFYLPIDPSKTRTSAPPNITPGTVWPARSDVSVEGL